MRKLLFFLLISFLSFLAIDSNAQQPLSDQDLYFADVDTSSAAKYSLGVTTELNRAGDRVFKFVKIPVLTSYAASLASDTDTTLITAIEDAIRHITDEEGHLLFPPKSDELTAENLFNRYVWFSGVLSSLLLFLLHWIWPSAKKKTLILKSTFFGLAIITAVIYYTSQGGSLSLTSGQVFIAFAFKVFFYDYALNPLGIRSKKLYKPADA